MTGDIGEKSEGLSLEKREPQPPAEFPGPGPAPVHEFNQTDMMAFAGAILAIAGVFACFTGGYGAYCLPVFGLVLGALGYYGRRQAASPNLTRQLSLVGMIGGGGIVVILIALLGACLAFYLVVTLGTVASGKPL